MNQCEFEDELGSKHNFQTNGQYYKKGTLMVWVGHKQVVIIQNDLASLIETTTHGGVQDFTKAFKTIQELIK